MATLEKYYESPNTMFQLANGDWFDYCFTCFDGYAYGCLTYEEDEGKAPHYIVAEYPKISEIRGNKEKEAYILKCRDCEGLEAEHIDYTDILIAYGKEQVKNNE